MTPTNDLDTALRLRAEQVRADLCAQDAAWGTSGWTRRRFLAGIGMAGVAALGSQLVTSRAAYAAVPSGTERTLLVVFLRGAADGLRILAPNNSALGLDFLKTVRGDLVPADSDLIALPGATGWGLNKKLQPLFDALWASGEMAFVPAVSSPGVSRSHFQAQAFLERGGTDRATSGWLERVLELLGPGTTFRAVTEGWSTPDSLIGMQPSLTLGSLDDFQFPGWDGMRAQAQKAVLDLYRGVGGPLGTDVPVTISALGTAAQIRATANTATYPGGSFSDALKDFAKILKADVGLQVATVDVGGWDTHTNEVNELDGLLDDTAAALRAFMDDLGPARRSRVTVAVMTEFGRRVYMNDSAGADHGHGGLIWLLGGGLASSGVLGKWNGLSAATLDNGDVAGLNSPFDVLGELVQKRLGVGALSTVFPGHTVAPIGVATTA
ncbi:MAG TPA: DUF1501 domain-containing protein [Jatrophihabitans sp.]|jgi:uncharacterized protein (DUF1501 family)|uniref:DUF1501 domain-containing protein n=1 Tax=Jatrophihabitans sp. TaxID=1932789 RepID=UPI002E019B79|nr:DUF1501 domain-containing protein [Jatrophihabitans sp.]